MVNLTIDQIPVSVPEGTTILEAAKQVGIQIPTLCYLKRINEISSCRVCLVGIEGKDKLVAACNNVVEEGMAVSTNSPKVIKNRKKTVQICDNIQDVDIWDTNGVSDRLSVVVRGGRKIEDTECTLCGQPIHDGQELAAERGSRLRNLDESSPVRFSHENKDIQRLYKDFFGEPNGHLAHQLLHTDHNCWDMPQRYPR